jgi:hypothetical protein
MSKISDLVVQLDSKAMLTKDEIKGLEKFHEKNGAPLGIDLANQLYQMFLNDKTCQDIHDSNKSVPFGAIVDARVRYEWDAKRKAYTDKLFEATDRRALMSQMSAVQFVSDLLTATHALQTDKINAYLATRNPIHLKGVIPIESIKDYKALIDTLATLTHKEEPPAPHTQTNVLVDARATTNPDSLPKTLDMGPIPSHSDFLSQTADDLAKAERAKKESADKLGINCG